MIDMNLANKCVILHALLEQTQSIIDELQSTNIYSQKLKGTAKMFSQELDKKIATWYGHHLQVAETQTTYLQVSKDLELAITALLSSNPATYKVIPTFIQALELGEIETK